MARSGDALKDRQCRLTILNPVATPNDFKNTTNERIEIDAGTGQNASDLGLRIQFKISKTLKKHPNTSEITVTNLSPNRRASLQQKGVRLILEAGYQTTGLSRYFAGDVRTVDHIREQADWETKFQLGDGERSWQFSRVRESFSPGTSAADVLKRLGRATGLGVGNLDQKAASITAVLDQGFAASGSASAEFDRLVKSIRMGWSIQDGEIQLLDDDDVLDLPIPEITPDSGLIGSPEMGSPPKKGKPQLVKFKALLLPTKPGAKVKLKSERYDGYVKVQACEFEGDTFGGDWYTTISGVLIK